MRSGQEGGDAEVETRGGWVDANVDYRGPNVRVDRAWFSEISLGFISGLHM